MISACTTTASLRRRVRSNLHSFSAASSSEHPSCYAGMHDVHRNPASDSFVWSALLSWALVAALGALRTATARERGTRHVTPSYGYAGAQARFLRLGHDRNAGSHPRITHSVSRVRTRRVQSCSDGNAQRHTRKPYGCDAYSMPYTLRRLTNSDSLPSQYRIN